MMTAEFIMSKRPVLKFTEAVFLLLKLFLSPIYVLDIRYILSTLTELKLQIPIIILTTAKYFDI